MTLLAGAFSRRGKLPHADALFVAMSALISRNEADHREVVRSDDAFLIKVDIGAFGTPAHIHENGVATFVTGEPIIVTDAASPRDRMTDTRFIHNAIRESRWSGLARARGLFAVAQYDRDAGRLVLATDRLGVRPLYWWSDGDTVLFASALRVFEGCALLRKELDLRGLAETLAVGAPLGHRTPYEGISMLRAAEIVEWNKDTTSSTAYWRWQDTEPSTASPEAQNRAAFDVFLEGVRLRNRDDRATTAFLSGGLDSRCAVGALRSLGVDVHTLTFGEPGTQDVELGALFAKNAGTTHETHPVDARKFPAWIYTMAAASGRSTAPVRSRMTRPRLVWTGDGGSVGLGLVHVTPRIVERSRGGDADGVVDEFLREEASAIPVRVLRKGAATEMRTAPRAGVSAELKRLGGGALAQTYYWFLLQNDQRRTVQGTFQEIDMHRLELQYPFLDANFLAVVGAVPIEQRLYHEFYNKWLAHFPASVGGTCWQAYPGHVPCPVPPPGEWEYQWGAKAAKKRGAAPRGRLVRFARNMVMSRGLASRVISRPMLCMAAIVHATGFRDYAYLIRGAIKIQTHWMACDKSAAGAVFSAPAAKSEPR